MDRPICNRVGYVDLMESIAMLFVLFYHCTTYQFDFLSRPSFLYTFRYFLRAILSTGVPLFFFVNGYLLFNRKFDLRKHIFKTIRLAVLAIIWGILLSFQRLDTWPDEFSIKGILKLGLFFIEQINNNTWFLGAIVCIYLFFPLLKSAFDCMRKGFVFFVIICAVMTFGNKVVCGAGTIAADILVQYPAEIKTNIFQMFNPFQGIYWYSFVYFCCGGLAHEMIPGIKAKQEKANVISAAVIPISMLCLTAWGIYLSKQTGAIWDIVWCGYDTVFTFANVIAIFVLCINYHEQSTKISKVIETVSRNTLGIYLMHEIFVRLTVYTAREIPIAANLIGTIVYALCILGICMAIIYVIKRIPLLKRLL